MFYDMLEGFFLPFRATVDSLYDLQDLVSSSLLLSFGLSYLWHQTCIRMEFPLEFLQKLRLCLCENPHSFADDLMSLVSDSYKYSSVILCFPIICGVKTPNLSIHKMHYRSFLHCLCCCFSPFPASLLLPELLTLPAAQMTSERQKLSFLRLTFIPAPSFLHLCLTCSRIAFPCTWEPKK